MKRMKEAVLAALAALALPSVGVPYDATPEIVPTRAPVRSAIRATLATSVLNRVNAIRASVGAPALVWDADLADAATRQAERNARLGRLSHGGAGCSSATGECCAYNSFGALYSVDQWYKSDPHRAIMTSKDYARAGFAVTRGSDGRYWCVLSLR